MKSTLWLYVFGLICIFPYTNPSDAGADDKSKQSVEGSCPNLTIKKEANNTRKVVTFSGPMGGNDVGFAVDLLFDNPVKNLKANDSRPRPATKYRVSETHWVIGVAKIKRKRIPKAEFTASFEDANNTQIVGVILNSDLLCGVGKSKVITPKTIRYDGHRVCTPEIKTYEHESKITFKEDFYSDDIGIAVDIFFSDNVDKVSGISNMIGKKRNDKHYSLFNHGYITSKDKPVTFKFNAYHRRRPPPKIYGLVINNIAICGFASTPLVYDPNSFSNVSSLLEQDVASFSSTDYVVSVANIISGCSLVVAILLCVIVWRLSSHQSKKRTSEVSREPTYAVPNKTK